MLGGQKLRASKVEDYLEIESSQNYLKHSTKNGTFFKDIDLKKATKILNGKFFIEPPSKIIVLYNIVKKEDMFIKEELEDIEKDLR